MQAKDEIRLEAVGEWIFRPHTCEVLSNIENHVLDKVQETIEWVKTCLPRNMYNKI